MNQAVMIINCYLYGATAVMLLVLLLIVYLRGQVNHFPNPFAKKNLVYRHPAQAKGVLFGKKFGLLAYSPEQDEGHILVLGPSGTGKTSALLIPTLRSWQGTALVVDISGDISANVNTPNKIVFDPTSENCIPYDVFASINEVTDDTERQERLEQLAYLLLPDKANDSEAGIFFTKNGRKMITAALICYYFIDCIIQLPGNLFFGTSIATCIMVLKKSKAENKTLFVDASKEFVKVTNNNKLTEDNIAKIVASFVDREDKDYFCRLVPNDEIATQDYNLSVSTYVEQEDTREVINITELNAEIKRIVAREQVLRDEIDKIIAGIEA